MKLKAWKDCYQPPDPVSCNCGKQFNRDWTQNILQNICTIIFWTINMWDTCKIEHILHFCTKDHMSQGISKRVGDKKVASNALNCWSAVCYPKVNAVTSLMIFSHLPRGKLFPISWHEISSNLIMLACKYRSR